MRCWCLLPFCFLSLALLGQESTLTREYTLVATIDRDASQTEPVPSSLLITPDKKYLLATLTGKTADLQVYDVKTGKLIKTLHPEKPVYLDEHRFTADHEVWLISRKKYAKVNIETGEVQLLKPKNIDGKTLSQLGNIITVTSWTWGKKYNEEPYPGRYVIRYAQDKVYLYYNLL